MKKLIVLTVVILLLLCGCDSAQSNTRFLLNTTVTVTLYGEDKQYLDDAFELCSQYEKLLSRTDQNSDIYKINNTQGAVAVNEKTVLLINASKQYYNLTDGKFDVTVGSVSQLWNFAAGVLPKASDIAAAIEKVDFKNIEINGNTVNANGSIIDLGAIAKGYISDKIKEELKTKKVEKAVLNLGGNVTVWGGEYTVGIRRPFTDNDVIAKVAVNNKTVATSGVYERCFEQDGVKYHHILDSKTGYPAKSDLLSATVICENGAAADAFSTVCILMGKQKAMEIIEQTENTEAVFVDKDYNVISTSGLENRNGKYIPLT